MKQTTNTILMIRPAAFSGNKQTAVNNYYQNIESLDSVLSVQRKALQEFDNLTRRLEKIGVHVVIIEDTLSPNKPDALFPNNWVSFHDNATMCLYPMYAKNRRWERREDIQEQLIKAEFLIEEVIDYSNYETKNLFLEGTGSMVLDRGNALAYCALSPRSSEQVLNAFCHDLNYKPIIFSAKQTVKAQRLPIYHTNVMMMIGEAFAMICLKSIDNIQERESVLFSLQQSGKFIIELSEEQLVHFAGNALQVKGSNDKSYLVLSQQAYESLTDTQIKQIEQFVTIESVNINTIEYYGGGSVRCMLAEIFLPKTHVT